MYYIYRHNFLPWACNFACGQTYHMLRAYFYPHWRNRSKPVCAYSTVITAVIC